MTQVAGCLPWPEFKSHYHTKNILGCILLDIKAQRDRQSNGSMPAQVYSGEETYGGCLQHMLESTDTYWLGVLKERKDLVRGGGIFSLWLAHCPLLGVVKEPSLVFWYLCWEIRRCLWGEGEPSLLEPNNSRVNQGLRWHKWCQTHPLNAEEGEGLQKKQREGEK
jgi:hypothetical protein